MSEKKQETGSKGLSPVYLTLWQDVWIALTKPRYYLRWALQPFKRSLTYLTYLNILLTIVFSAYLQIVLKPALFVATDWVRESIPMLTYENGRLQIEDDQAIGFSDSDDIFVKIDPTQSAEDEPFIDSFYESGFLLTSDQLLIKNPQDTQVFTLSEILPFNFAFSGPDAADWVEKMIPVMQVAVPLLIFLYLMISKLIHTAIFTFFLYLFNGMRYPFKQLWSLSLYSLTPALLVGYLSLFFKPILGLYTAVFLFYFTSAFLHYYRFQQLKNKRQSQIN